MSLPSFIRPGANVRLKGGARARIYATDGGDGFPIHGAIEVDGKWVSSSWQEDLTWAQGESACTIVGPDCPDYSALWPLLPPWIRFLAMDDDGRLWAYPEEPIPIASEKGWSPEAGSVSNPYRIPDSYCPPPVGWRESLAERPAP